MKIRPTLLVGLGGQGRAVLAALRIRLKETGWAQLLDGPVTFLALDTYEAPWLGGELPHEQIALNIDDPAALIKANPQQIEPWWQEGAVPLDGLKAGTFGQRAYGRLAFFQHFETLKTRLMAAHARIRDPAAIFAGPSIGGPSFVVDLEQPTDVFVVSSTGGGTGSGLLLDLSFLIKQQFRGHGVHLQAFLLSPQGAPQDGLGWANTYALLKEINHYSYGQHSDLEWSRGQKLIVPPLDQCYLFQTPPEEGLDPVTMVAEAILTDLVEGEFSDHKRSLRVNLKQYNSRTFDVEHADFTQQFICRYSSLGQSTWRVPYSSLKRLGGLQLAREVLESWFHPDPAAKETPQAELKALFVAIGIEAEELKTWQGMLNTLVFGDRPAELTERLRGWADEWIQALDAGPDPAFDPFEALEYSTRALDQQFLGSRELQSRAEKLYQAGVGRIETYLGVLVTRSGLEGRQLEATLGEIKAALERALAILQQQVAWSAENQRLQANHALRILSQLRRVQTRHNWDGRKASIRRNLQSAYFQATIDFGAEPGWLACWAWERAGYEALEVCRKLTRYLEENLRPRVSRLGPFLRELEQQLVEPIAEELSFLGSLRDGADWPALAQQIYQNSLAANQALQHCREQLANRQEGGLLGPDGEHLLEALVRICSLVFQRLDIDYSPVHLLTSQLPVGQRVSLLMRLVQSSRPWIRGRRQNHLFSLHEHQTQRLIGLPALADRVTPLERDRHSRAQFQLKDWITAQLPQAFGFADLDDKESVVFYQEAAGFPLNFLEELVEARQLYLRIAMSGQPLHIFREVDPAQDFHIYSPAEFLALQAAMRCFVLGCLFNLIDYRSGHYRWAGRESGPSVALVQRERLLPHLANSEALRERLLGQASQQLAAILGSENSDRIAILGGLLALQKKAVYGPLWGRVSTPAELPPWDRLEIAVLSSLEEELQISLASQRNGMSALLAIVDNMPESMAGRAFLREDGRYSFSASATAGENDDATLAATRL